MSVIKWTKEKCQEEALKYDGRKLFQKGYRNAYAAAQRNGWLDNVCSHMKPLHKNWTLDNLKKEALKYKTRTIFYKKSKVAYMKSCDLKIMDEICSHMKPQGSLKDRYIYVFEFKETNSVYVGLTWNLKRRYNEHINPTKKHKNGTVYKYIRKNKDINLTFKELGYYDMITASKKEGEWLEVYKKDGWNILNRTKTGALGGNMLKWTYNKCKNDALKYKTRKDYQNNSGSSYSSALNNEWLDDICSHMKELKKPNGYWTRKRCQIEALKYETKSELIKKSSACYDASWKNNWLDDICIHMENRIKWSYGICKEKALECKTRSHFHKEYGRGYFIANKNNWLDEFFPKK